MRAALLALPLAFALAACDDSASGTGEAVSEADADTGTLAGAIPADSRFAAALEAAGLDSLFEGPEPYTVLLPPDDAFPETLPEDEEELAALLTLHILPGTFLGDDILAALEDDASGEVTLPSYGGSDLTVTRQGDQLRVSAGGDPVVLSPAGEPLEDGVVHRIDGLLTP